MTKPIALFIDGTYNHFGASSPTNVWRLYERLMKRTSFAQCPRWYLDGVGAVERGARKVPIWEEQAALRKPLVPGRAARRLLGGAAGYGASKLIKQGYAFLSAHYQPGDPLFLFGFSRGAFIARSLAGFIAEVGLLLKDHLEVVEKAYSLYVSKDSGQRNQLQRYLRRVTGQHRPSEQYLLPVHLLGLWDTVEAYGLPRPLQTVRPLRTDYHRIGIPAFVTHVRHALALHECRASFDPTVFDEALQTHQSLEQRWFAGAHADVGGGYSERHALPQISLEWMAGEAQRFGLPVDVTHWDGPATDLVKVHHEVRGLVFGWRPARIRPALHRLVKSDPRQFPSHRLDPHAARRLLALGTDPYPFCRFDVGDACQTIDVLSAALVLRRTQADADASVDDWRNLSLGILSGATARILTVVGDPDKAVVAKMSGELLPQKAGVSSMTCPTPLRGLRLDMVLLVVLGGMPAITQILDSIATFRTLYPPETETAAITYIDRMGRLLQVPSWVPADGRAYLCAFMAYLSLQHSVPYTTRLPDGS